MVGRELQVQNKGARLQTTSSDGVTIRLAKAGDAEKVNVFHNDYYKLARTTGQWLWEFNRAPSPDGSIPLAIAEFEGRIVGTQALIVIDMISREGTFPTAKSEETLVDASMRGRNLFARMYEPLLEYARSARVAFIWGFTPAQSAFSKAGFDVPVVTSQVFRSLGGRAAQALQR